jgi:hypothetical protein
MRICAKIGHAARPAARKPRDPRRIRLDGEGSDYCCEGASTAARKTNPQDEEI